MKDSKQISTLSSAAQAASFVVLGLALGCSAGTSSLPATVSQASMASTASSASAIVLSPADQTLSPNASLQYSTSGGTPPYTYSVASGGGSIGASTGLYMAPSTGANVEVAVQDAAGNYSYATLTISSSTLVLNSAFGTITTSGAADQITASGGTPPYTYAVISGGGTISGTGLYTAPSTLPATATSVELSVEDSAGTIAYSVIVVGMGSTATSTGTTPHYFGEAATNSVLAGWPVSNVLADNGVSCYSSASFTTATPSTPPYVAAWFNTPTNITKINLAARMLNGVPLAFPLSYQVYVTDPTNATWLSIGTYTTQPISTGGLTITLSQTVSTYGFLIVANQLGTDNLGGIYFQLCGLSAD